MVIANDAARHRDRIQRQTREFDEAAEFGAAIGPPDATPGDHNRVLRFAHEIDGMLDGLIVWRGEVRHPYRPCGGGVRLRLENVDGNGQVNGTLAS